MHNVICALALVALLGADTPAFAEPAPSTLTLRNGARQETLSRTKLAAMPHVPVAMSLHGAAHVFEGVPLTHLLQQVGAPAGEALHGEALGSIVVVTARDGYRVSLSLAETDASVRKEPVILADSMDGAPIGDADGPYRLVVSGDLRPARSARMVQSLQIQTLKGR